MSNAASSGAISGWKSYKLEEDFATLSQMFPACDVSILRNYLEIFCDDPNYMSTIVNMLLEADSSSDTNHGQNSREKQEGNSQSHCGLKRKTAIDEDSIQNECVSGEVTSPREVMRSDNNSNETSSSKSPNILEEIDQIASKPEFMLSSISSERKVLSPSKVVKCDLSDNDKTSSTKPAMHLSGGKITPSEENDIVFVKSVASSPKPSFYRTGFSGPGTSTGTPRQHSGICIRHKGGALHPSMNKPKRLQVVELDDDGASSATSIRSAPKRVNSSASQSPDRKHLNNPKMCPTTVTATSVSIDDDLPMFCSSAGLVSNKKETGNNANLTHVGKESSSFEKNQVGDVLSSDHEGLPVTAALADLEILKKVFPEADPDYIISLLDKHADQPNRVALVGKELGSNANPQSAKKKVSLVPWFWLSDEVKMVPFTDSECNALEKEYSSYDPIQTGVTSVKIKLPGSAKSYDVNFAAMTMTGEKGLKTMIVRSPGTRSEESKRAGVIPQEALTVPMDWKQQSNSVELITVRPGSAEWDHVQRSLTRSLRTAQVTDIQRVQNKWLHRKYAIQRHLMKDKNGPSCINEKELFHGTRHTNPEVIWKGEDGFDMRHSADGMWGRGTYFASEALYCHQGFVHFDPQRQQYQLFLAHVLTGDSVTLPPNRSIKMPPPKGGSNVRYDSVNGVTNGCTVYILYKLDMAYPAYLISYTTND